jgi:hypothetical protein
MKRINSRLMDLLERKGKLALPEVAQIIKHEAARRLENRRAKSNHFNHRQRCYCFEPSQVLEDLKLKMFRGKNPGNPNTFNSRRTKFQKLLKF